MVISEQLEVIEELFCKGNQGASLEIYRNLMNDIERSYDIWVNYAAFLFRCKKYEESIEASKKSLDIQHSAEGFHNLGACYDKMGQAENSIAAYKKAIKIKPDFVQSHNDIANIYESIGSLDFAIDHFQIATALSPAIYSYWCSLARARQSAGRFNEALTALLFMRIYLIGHKILNIMHSYQESLKIVLKSLILTKNIWREWLKNSFYTPCL